MAAVVWTEVLDLRLRRMRDAAAGWAAIGAAFGVSADVARERGRRIGAAGRRSMTAAAAAAAAEPDDADADDPDRAALPAGHPRAWRLLTAGTLLDGQDWPGYQAGFAAGGGQGRRPGAEP